MRIAMLMVALLLGCAEDVTPQGWYCWKPESNLHNGPCVDECMEPGDPRSYCWCEVGCFGVEENDEILR